MYYGRLIGRRCFTFPTAYDLLLVSIKLYRKGKMVNYYERI